MKKSLLALGAALALSLSAHASVLPTQTQPSAESVSLYGTFHDGQTDFVFVKLPHGWAFVAQDTDARSHDVFVDASTGFVFVKLSGGWKFVQRV